MEVGGDDQALASHRSTALAGHRSETVQVFDCRLVRNLQRGHDLPLVIAGAEHGQQTERLLTCQGDIEPDPRYRGPATLGEVGDITPAKHVRSRRAVPS